ncbi:MAG: hypothetical protein ACRDJG_05035 [Actinomycetota bacterium]
MGERTRSEALAEAYLLYLEGRGPEPSLAGLDEAERAEVSELFRILAATHGVDPRPLWSFQEDPVAIELGFVEPPGSMIVSGAAVAAARRSRGFTRREVLRQLAALGATADEGWLEALEDGSAPELGWVMVRSLAGVLGVPVHRLMSGSPGREEPREVVASESDAPGPLAFRVQAALAALGYAYRLDLDARPYAGTDLGRSRFVVEHLDAAIRVCLHEGQTRPDQLLDPEIQRVAQQVVRSFPDTWAVASVVEDEELSCVILDAYELAEAISAPTGKRAASRATSEMILPFPLAVSKYFESVVPIWDPIEQDAVVLTPIDVAGLSRSTAHAAVARMKRARLTISAKRQGYGKLGEEDADAIASVIEAIYERQLSGEGLSMTLEDLLRRAS